MVGNGFATKTQNTAQRIICDYCVIRNEIYTSLKRLNMQNIGIVCWNTADSADDGI